jgi:hypothetical protein
VLNVFCVTTQENDFKVHPRAVIYFRLNEKINLLDISLSNPSFCYQIYSRNIPIVETQHLEVNMIDFMDVPAVHTKLNENHLKYIL